MSAITIKNLYKSFSDKKVIENLNLNIPYGERICIMGSSGCGKTTLINILLGLEKEDSGIINGIPKQTTAVFQEDRLCEDFSALSNVRMVLNTKDSTETAKSALIALGLEQALNKPVKALSGGMKRRVAIARALVALSDFVILDEPFKGLDDDTKDLVIDYVDRSTAGKTLLLITHDAEEAKLLGATVYHMENHSILKSS